jgi:hypothetical protein
MAQTRIWENYGLDPIDDDAELVILSDLAAERTRCRGFNTYKSEHQPLTQRFGIQHDYVPLKSNLNIRGPYGSLDKGQLVAYVGEFEAAEFEDDSKGQLALSFPALVIDVRPISDQIQRVTSLFERDFGELRLRDVDEKEPKLLDVLMTGKRLKATDEKKLFGLWIDFE